ncbi:MAG: hypothetical protein SPLUMA2_SPLUMAMAG2_00227 [uncultured Sulfurimonas sp.]|nr:MAG: hypothetical protein SPLUMA1_SPLUMAMAG1_00780 [uncultured Sulfurimonas sp.]CAI6151823.1 MAG: hypothetical protein SPLUMA2_SPLUMAMAG2_00227 [uncultured Sulfurimonas sp.]
MEHLPMIVAVIAFSGILYAIYDAITHKSN